MKFDKKNMVLYAVTDRMWLGSKTLYEQVEEALKGGITCLQLREKNLNDDEFLEESFKIKKICKKYNVPFIVNDNVDIAIKCGADGIHVGQKDMSSDEVRAKIGKSMILGVSTQTVKQAIEAEKYGADYLGVGAVFPTNTKTDADFVDYNALKKICEAVTIPVVAIGGINEKNIMQLKGSGIDGVALVSGIFASENITDTCKKFYDLSSRVIQNGN